MPDSPDLEFIERVHKVEKTTAVHDEQISNLQRNDERHERNVEKLFDKVDQIAEDSAAAREQVGAMRGDVDELKTDMKTEVRKSRQHFDDKIRYYDTEGRRTQKQNVSVATAVIIIASWAINHLGSVTDPISSFLTSG